MKPQLGKQKFGRFNLHEVARAFPPSAETLLLDTYLTDEPSASSRVFRVYRATPPHYHEKSDEHLFVLSGRGTFWMESPSRAICWSSSDARSMPCRTSSSRPSSSSRSTRRGAILETLSSSIRRTARRRASSAPIIGGRIPTEMPWFNHWLDPAFRGDEGLEAPQPARSLATCISCRHEPVRLKAASAPNT